MNKKEWAEKLNNREYMEELSQEECEALKQQQLVVVFGAGDDLMEFRGAIYQECDCYGGGTATLNESGLFDNRCEDARCPYFHDLVYKAIKKHLIIKAIWDKDGYCWVYDTEIPHETFDILEDGEKYCRGIIFDFKDLGD